MRGNILARAVKGPRPLFLIYIFIYLSLQLHSLRNNRPHVNDKPLWNKLWKRHESVKEMSSAISVNVNYSQFLNNRNYYEDKGTENGISRAFIAYFVSERWLIHSYVFLILCKLPCQWHFNRLRDITELQTLLVPTNALFYILCILMSVCSYMYRRNRHLQGSSTNVVKIYSNK
jgi:hypothetical protein